MNIDVLHIVGQIVTYGGGTFAVCYFALRTFGLRWLDEKFKKRLLDFEQQQKREFERYQYEINKLFNRVNKVQSKEFVVLPKAWEKLQLAHGVLSDMIFPFQSYPDLDRMRPPELNEFLKKSELFEFQKEELLLETSKLNYYRDKIFWIRYKKVADLIMEFHNYIILKKIFLQKDMFDLFSEIDGRLNEAYLLSMHLGGRNYDPDVGGELSGRLQLLEPLIKNLEVLIQGKLHFEDAD